MCILIVSVDTEEEFDWSATGTAGGWSMNHVGELPWFQDLCENYGVRPTYVVDYPIATTESAIEMLGSFLKRGACEIGAHPHPWVNPPIREEICPRNTYLCNLPIELQQEKIANLTEAIRNAFGIQPTTFKAGRYGIDFRLVPFLRALGYTVDSSVMPFTSFTDDGGPDFRDDDSKAFRLSARSGEKEEAAAELLEVPCTVGFNRRPFRFWHRVHQHLSKERYRRLHPVGVLSRLRVMRKIVLSPELASLPDMLTLMRVLAKEPNAVLNVTLHSPSVQAGNTPYVRTNEDLQRFKNDLVHIFKFAVHDLNAQCMTLSEFYDHQKARVEPHEYSRHIST